MTYLRTDIGIDADTLYSSPVGYPGQLRIADDRLGDLSCLVSNDPDAWGILAAECVSRENALRAKASAGAGETAQAEAPAEDTLRFLTPDEIAERDLLRPADWTIDTCDVYGCTAEPTLIQAGLGIEGKWCDEHRDFDDDPVFADARHGE